MNQVSWVRQLILAVLLCALGAFAYWLQAKHKPHEEEVESASKKFFQLKGEQVEEVAVSDGKATYAFRCEDLAAKICKPGDNAQWEMTSPIKAKADDSNVNSFVSTLNNLDTIDTIDLKDETADKRKALMKEYGLTPEDLSSPSMKKVTAKASNGTTVVYFGAINPVGDSYFSAIEKVPPGAQPTGKFDDSKIYIAPSYFKTNFDQNLTHWRDKKVLPIVPMNVRSLTIDSKKNGVIKASRKGAEWTLDLPSGNVPGDIENLDGYLSSLSFLSAKDFAADDKNSARAKEILKGAKKVVTVKLVTSSTTEPTPSPSGSPKPQSSPGSNESKTTISTVTMDVYEKPGSKPAPATKRGGKPPLPPSTLYAVVSDSDPLYELQPAATIQIDKSIKDFRLQKLITSSERFGAKRLEFKGPALAEPLILVNKDSKWKIEPGDRDANNSKVQDTLDKLSGNRIQEFLPASKKPPGSDVGLTLTLGTDKSEKSRQLLLWRDSGKLYACDLVSKCAEIFLVDSAVDNALPWQQTYFDNTPTPAPSTPPKPGGK